ncbi:MAG TPA: hypothetical protein VN700_04925 [Vicinamibacterales bacterium]|nr:hypothetical protein [Vicinamibacterales bacterium]
MTPEEAALVRVIGLLETAGIPYMVTGSIATSYHGRPRATHDADVVIDPSPAQLDSFLETLESAGFFVNADGARGALQRRSQFNAIEIASATKVDVIFRKDRPFSQEEFARRQRVDFAFASSVAVVTPEDAILSKLEWARSAGDSERQVRDASGVLALNPGIDRRYIEQWAVALGVIDLWRRIETG